MLLIKNQTFLSSGNFSTEIITRQAIESFKLPKSKVVLKGSGSTWAVGHANNFRKIEEDDQIKIVCDVSIREEDYRNFVKEGSTALVPSYVVGSKGTGSYNRPIIKEIKELGKLFLSDNPISKQSVIQKENVNVINKNNKSKPR